MKGDSLVFRKLFLAALVTLFAACARTEAPVRPSCPAGKVCLHRGNTSEPVSLDPHRTSGTWENRIISDMIQGLFDLDPDGRPVPAMAESWTTSPDGLTWTFRLRDTVWSDGVPVTAEDFVYAYRRILKPETASQYSFLLYALVNGQAINEGRAAPETLGARALDARTLQLTLNNPAPYLPELTTHYSFYPLPRHVVEAKGAAWIRPGNYVSNGPYILADWRQGDRVRTVRNPRFWDNANVCYDEVYFYPTVD
ncbi:MAG TPA: peptide ABC transporter substrate-binding protein, partial [Caulobacteraceae bacterium]